MRLLFLIGFLFLSTGAKAYLGYSSFERASATSFKVKSFFYGGSNFSGQVRVQTVRNDTLFIRLVYETRFAANALGCTWVDTLTQEILYPSIRCINVSTGKITFDTTDWTLADTLWSMFDSTFAAVPPPQFIPYCSNGQLKITGPEAVTGLTLFDMNGKLLLKTTNDPADIPFLAAGVYLLHIVAASGAEETIRWYRE